MWNRLVVALLVAGTAASAAQQSSELRPQASGTGVITGRVIDAGTGAPVSAAIVRMHQTRGETLRGVYPRSEAVVTDSAGVFEFRNLPAGQFSIETTADGYEPGAVGKRRRRGDEVWITLNIGQRFSDAVIELFRGGTISGGVTNDRGEPMKGVHIETWGRSRSGQLEYRHGAVSDEAGRYRITAIPAGEYFIVAGVWHSTTRQGPPTSGSSPCDPPIPPPPPGTQPRPVVVESPVVERPRRAQGEWFSELPRWIPEPTPDDRGQPRTIPTTIYPGVTDVSQASVVKVLSGEEVTGIDLQFRPTSTSNIQGRIVPPPGKKIGTVSEVRLRLPGAPANFAEHTTRIQPDNSFRFVGVPPGPYTLEVELGNAIDCDVIVRSGQDVVTHMSVDVPPGGIDNLIVPIASGVTMTGAIHFVGTTARPQSIDIWLIPTAGGKEKSGDWDTDARIIAGGLSQGGYALEVSENGEPRWFVRSMTLRGLDLAIRPMSIDREDVSGVDVTMIDRPSPLGGRIIDAAGNAVRDATVVVFPVDRTAWATAHDRLAGFPRRRSIDGTYRFEHIIPGDYYVAAVDERRMGDWPRAAFLESVAKQSAAVRIAAGEPRTLMLTLQEPSLLKR